MKPAVLRLRTAFWYSTTVLTGILAGFMVSHAIMLGRFFNWYVESGNGALLRQTYTVFRLESSPQVPYNIPLYLALLSGILWAILCFIAKKDRIVALTAGLSTLWVGVIFYASELREAEEAVLTGTASEALTQHYLAVNIPVHSAFAAIYLVSFVLLLWSARRRGKETRAAD
jgi:hypothetical protein